MKVKCSILNKAVIPPTLKAREQSRRGDGKDVRDRPYREREAAECHFLDMAHPWQS